MEVFTLRRVSIKDVQFGERSEVRDSTLFVSSCELEALILEDRFIKGVSVEIARPGESKRIVPVKDILEPRAKLDPEQDIFPGVISDPNYAPGYGTTVVLDGVCVMTSGKLVNFQEGLVDMAGPGAEYSLFSKKNNVVLVLEPADGITKHDHERAVRLAPLIPAGAVKVAESGVRCPDDTRALRAAGYDAVLVGETIVTAGDPAGKVAELIC